MEIRGIVLHPEVVGHGKAVRIVLVLEDKRLSFEVVGLPYVEDRVEALLFQLLLYSRQRRENFMDMENIMDSFGRGCKTSARNMATAPAYLC